MGLTFKFKKKCFNLCFEAQEEIRNWFSSHLKRRKKWAEERHALLLGRWKVTIPGVNHRFCWPLRKGQSQFFFLFFCASSLHFFVVVVTFYLCSSVTFSSFLVLCLFFLISHHHFMWAVKIQRSDRQLPWDSWASNHCSLHTYHHYNSYHPDHCRAPALAFMKAPPPNSPRNVPGFLLLVFYLNYTLLMPSSSDSYHIWFHGCGVLFFFFL